MNTVMNTTYAPLLERRETPYPGDDDAISYTSQLGVAHHSCCCSAQPAVVAVLPPSTTRDHPTELLLCGHHYRGNRARLNAAHAKVFDRNGVRVLEQDDPYFAGSAPSIAPAPC